MYKKYVNNIFIKFIYNQLFFIYYTNSILKCPIQLCFDIFEFTGFFINLYIVQKKRYF